MKTAFDGCAREYARARPSYPPRLVSEIRRAFGLRRADTVIDVGAGTGLSSLVFLRAGFRVIPVEPSLAMARQGARFLRERGHVVRYRRAPAEKTGLRSGMARAVVVGQAMHWFDAPRALEEFHRLLAPSGGLALFWNNRDASRSRFLRGYERLLRRMNPTYSTDYRYRRAWGRIIGASKLFERAALIRILWTTPSSLEHFRTYSRSVSYLGSVLTEETWPLFERDLEALIRREHPRGRFPVPYVTDLWLARRKGT